jgi:hypothetical protein
VAAIENEDHISVLASSEAKIEKRDQCLSTLDSTG